MQAKTLKLFAICLVALSLALAAAGYRLSQSAPASAPITPMSSQPAHPAVAAARELNAGETLQAADIAVISTPFAIENSFADTTSLIGKTLRKPLHKGGILNEDTFRAGGALVQETTPGLRAVAIRVDETAGAGGFLQPGDHVDVFYTMHAAEPGKNRSLAGVLVRNARILAFGSDLVERGANSKEEGSGKLSRSAVLEVEPLDVSRLLLAETNGVLRLAAIGAREKNNAPLNNSPLLGAGHSRALISLNELGGAGGAGQVSETIEIFQGDQLQTKDVNELKTGAPQ